MRHRKQCERWIFSWASIDRSRFQTPAARFQEARRDVRSTNNSNSGNNNNNIRGRKAPANGNDNKQKQHDNKRVNNQVNSGVRPNASHLAIEDLIVDPFRKRNINRSVPKKISSKDWNEILSRKIRMFAGREENSRSPSSSPYFRLS